MTAVSNQVRGGVLMHVDVDFIVDDNRDVWVQFILNCKYTVKPGPRTHQPVSKRSASSSPTKHLHTGSESPVSLAGQRLLSPSPSEDGQDDMATDLPAPDIRMEGPRLGLPKSLALESAVAQHSYVPKTAGGLSPTKASKTRQGSRRNSKFDKVRDGGEREQPSG